jgi:hypothetical protein
MTRLDELKAKERALWTVVVAMRGPMDEATKNWQVVYNEIRDETIRENILAEMAKEKDQNGNA